MRLAIPLALLVLLASLVGCGSGDETDTGPARPPAGSPVQVRTAWEREAECERPPDASRWGCSVGAYRCQAVVAGRGWSVSCSKPGESIGFLVRP